MDVSQDTISDVEVESLQYFHADVTRLQAEDMLQRYKNTPDHFLLRWSSSYGKIAISCVLKNRKIGHALIFRSADGCFFLEDKASFDTLDGLVKHYSRFGIPNFPERNLFVRLRFPVAKFRRPAPCPWQIDPVQYEILNNPQYARLGEHIPKLRARQEQPRKRVHPCPSNVVTSLLTPPSTPPKTHGDSVFDITCPKLVRSLPNKDQTTEYHRYISMDSLGKKPSCIEAPPVPKRITIPS